MCGDNVLRQGLIKCPAFFFLLLAAFFNVLLVWYKVTGYTNTPAVQVKDTWSILEATVSSVPVGLMRQRYIRTQRFKLLVCKSSN